MSNQPEYPNGDVTIGIPVFNEEMLIERAVRSVVKQCGRLLISDNASTDETQSICRQLQAEFPNISYFRQPNNLGSFENFHFLLSKVTSPYYMMLGSHDFVSPGFVGSLRNSIESNSNAVAAMGSLFFLRDSQPMSQAIEDAKFNAWKGGEIQDRLKRVRATTFDDTNISWCVYGLYNTAVFKKFFTRDLPVVGGDNVFLCQLATEGRILRSGAAQYFAWSRTVDSGEDYVERVTAKPRGSYRYGALRREMRVRIYDNLLSVYGPVNVFLRLKLKFEVMCRYGPFSTKRFDPSFWVFYFPAKFRSEFRRFLRRLRG